jgi:hypothetical protein
MTNEKEHFLKLDESASVYADKYANRGSTIWYHIYEAFTFGAEYGRKTVKPCGCGEVKVEVKNKCSS